MDIEGYFYDPAIDDCRMYLAGGCRSSPGQSFGLREDCIKTCVHGTRRIQDIRSNNQ